MPRGKRVAAVEGSEGVLQGGERAVCSAEAMRGVGRLADSAGSPKAWQERHGRESRGKRGRRAIVTRRE